MRRTWHIWIAFALCLAVLLTAMGWISLGALRLDRAEAEARRHEALARRQAEQARRQEAQARREAELEQEVQLALYRMEFALTPLVTQESARPYTVYNTFLPVEAAYGPDVQPPPGGLATSPLLKEVSRDILVYFQFEPDGRITSPHVPDPARRHLVVPQHVGPERVEEAERQLARVAAMVDRDALLAMLPDSGPEPVPAVVVPFEPLPQQSLADGQVARSGGRQQRQAQSDVERQARDLAEYNLRSQAVKQSANVMLQNAAVSQLGEVGVTSHVGGAMMTPLWIDGNLILARRVRAGKRQYVQGCLLDWPTIKQNLLMAIEDLLPEADLEPVATAPAEEVSRRLAALPVRLIPGRRVRDETIPALVIPELPAREAAGEAEGAWSPTKLSLSVAWGCVLLAAVAVGALLAGVIRLSNRRAAFVSAVTHELRTPLTTFHMYTEMLAEGMVPDQNQQQEYLSTLRGEASRLSHLVENVLSYARLERGRADGRIENVPLGELLEPIEARLADRARQDGMEMIVEGDERAFCTVVRANPSAVEQILLNLVDNAGKYAQTASDKRIHLACRRTDGAAEVVVRDHGPGISPSASRRLFRSFSKSAHEAAHSAPGVGLGLALSRRLARDMGGSLRLDKTVTDGACFVLTLPASDKPLPPRA